MKSLERGATQMIESKYTIVLKNLLDNPESKKVIDKALSTYPLYERQSKEEFIPSYIPTRDELNNKILNYYKYREIGFETVGRFADELEIAMCEIMPKYNQLFFSQDQDYNILFNVDYTRTTERSLNNTNKNTTNVVDSTVANGSEKSEATSTSTGTNESSANDSTTTSASVNNYNKNVKSQTPQNNLDIANTGIDTVSYADEVSFNKDTNSDSGTSTGTSEANSSSTLEGTNTNSTATKQKTDSTSDTEAKGESQEAESTTENTKGNFGVMATQDLIEKYRNLIINIEQQIINDERISELFMRVW